MTDTFSKVILSGSTDGRPIAVAATSSPGTTIHTAGAGQTNRDLLYLQAINVSAGSVKLTIEFGGTSTSDDIMQYIPAQSGMQWVVKGLPLQNSLIVKAFAGITNVINITGYVNRDMVT
jgi:hypothetical protein